MNPISYFDVMRDSQHPNYLRLKMVRYVQAQGIQPAARAFGTTVKTLRKWLGGGSRGR